MTYYKNIYDQKFTGGELWLQFCTTCRKYVFYPRSLCPSCWQPLTEWKPVSGRGHVHSYTIVNISVLPEFKEKTPYIYALIDLEEGFRMPSNLIDCPIDEVEVGMPVQITFIDRDSKTLPVFKPREKTITATISS